VISNRDAACRVYECVANNHQGHETIPTLELQQNSFKKWKSGVKDFHPLHIP
jgi:hypothetical protein